MTENNFVFAQRVIEHIMKLKTRQLANMTVVLLATQLNVSKSYLQHTFYNETRRHPGEFLRVIKLMEATRLLEKNTKLPIKKIAKTLGFETPDHFSRIFKESFGTTPSQYRKSAQNHTNSNKPNNPPRFPWPKFKWEIKRPVKSFIKKMWEKYHIILKILLLQHLLDGIGQLPDTLPYLLHRRKGII